MIGHDILGVEELDDRASGSGFSLQKLFDAVELVDLAAHRHEPRTVGPFQDAIDSVVFVFGDVGLDESQFVGAREIPQQLPQRAERLPPVFRSTDPRSWIGDPQRDA